MTAAEFEAYVEGRTMTFGTGGAPYGAEEYRPGRRVRWSVFDGECYEGVWYPAGDEILLPIRRARRREVLALHPDAAGARGALHQRPRRLHRLRGRALRRAAGLPWPEGGGLGGAAPRARPPPRPAHPAARGPAPRSGHARAREEGAADHRHGRAGAFGARARAREEGPCRRRPIVPLAFGARARARGRRAAAGPSSGPLLRGTRAREAVRASPTTRASSAGSGHARARP